MQAVINTSLRSGLLRNRLGDINEHILFNEHGKIGNGTLTGKDYCQRRSNQHRFCAGHPLPAAGHLFRTGSAGRVYPVDRIVGAAVEGHVPADTGDRVAVY